MDQLKQIEDPEIKPHTYEHLIIDKEAKTMQWEKESIFNSGADITRCHHVEHWKYIHIYHHVQNSNPGDQRPQHKSRYTEPDRTGSAVSLECIGTGDHFLNVTPAT